MVASRRIPYERCRFSTSLPEELIYTAAHQWLCREEGDVWRIGLTRFATRMLGDMVELGFECEPGAGIVTGQVVGWLEGFKATADIHAPLAGRFESANPALDHEIELLNRDTYGRGWLFRARGNPGEHGLDVYDYVSVLDDTIDRMLRGADDRD
jgi:glycine cleavage system H protein